MVRHCRRMSVCQPVGRGLHSYLADSPPQKPRIVAEHKSIPGLYAGVAPPLRLLAVRCINVCVERAHPLSLFARLPYFVGERIGSFKFPVAPNRIRLPPERRLYFELRIRVCPNPQHHVARAYRVVVFVAVGAFAGYHAVRHRRGAMRQVLV